MLLFLYRADFVCALKAENRNGAPEMISGAPEKGAQSCCLSLELTDFIDSIVVGGDKLNWDYTSTSIVKKRNVLLHALV